MALPSNPVDGQLGTKGDLSYVFDAAFNRWLVAKSNIKIDDLNDVDDSYAPEQGHVLLWDSDNGYWKPNDIQVALGASALKINSFIASDEQRVFHLTNLPINDVIFIRNGIQLYPDEYVVTGKTVTYTSGYVLRVGDKIQLYYNVGSNTGFSSELNSMTDVDYNYGTLEQNDVLGWDSESETFKSYNIQSYITTLENRITELEGDLLQAVSDRIYTDQTLQTQITNNDSDIAASGRFFVQATPPTGGPNSGWVNTTNMRLHVWDTDEGVWVETVLT
jgi:hypothetical protein